MATEVDHIVPVARGGALLDWDNLQSMCHGCHSRKTASEDGGFGNM
jgi:5-methylcytosine-specific restriction protein A